jgi:hypothetical protein
VYCVTSSTNCAEVLPRVRRRRLQQSRYPTVSHAVGSAGADSNSGAVVNAALRVHGSPGAMAVAETVADFVRSFRGAEALARRRRWCFSQ